MQDKYALQLILLTAWWLLHVTIKQGPFAAINLRDIQGGILVVQHHLSQIFKIGFMLKTELIFGECQNSVPGDHKQSDHFARTISLFLAHTQAETTQSPFPGADTRSSGALPPKSFQLYMEMFLFLPQFFFENFPIPFPLHLNECPYDFPMISQRGLSENVVCLHPMVNDQFPY